MCGGQAQPPNVGGGRRMSAAAPHWPAPPPPPPELFLPVPGVGRNIITPNRLRATQTTYESQSDLFGLSPPTSPAAPPPPAPRRDSPGEPVAPAFGTLIRMAELFDLQPPEVELGQKILLEVSSTEQLTQCFQDENLGGLTG